MRPMLLFLLIETLYFTITILHLMYFVKTAQYCYTLLVYYYYYYYFLMKLELELITGKTHHQRVHWISWAIWFDLCRIL